MRIALVSACLALAGSTAVPASQPAPAGLQLPESVSVLDGRNGTSIPAAELLRRLAAADVVLLGEVHDNGLHHALRGRLIGASAALRPAIVFEQFPATDGPIALPAQGIASEAWLDRNGFDLASWNWPLHRPVVDAAIAHGRSIRGSIISRESLRSVVQTGEAGAPPRLRSLLEQAPTGSAAQAVLDRELRIGHCDQLPESMIPGMRAAQTVRDAAMARALLDALAAEGGPAWLIAGNGHVRRDIAVPRLLRAVEPDLEVVAVGFLERSADGSEPAAAERAAYDLVVVTPRSERPDPCAGFRVR